MKLGGNLDGGDMQELKEGSMVGFIKTHFFCLHEILK